ADRAELLRGSLVNRFRDHPNSTPDQRTDEVGDVVDPDRELTTFQHRRRRAHAGSALDGRRIRASVDHAPGRVLIRTELDPGDDPARLNRLELHAERRQERWQVLEAGKRFVIHDRKTRVAQPGVYAR